MEKKYQKELNLNGNIFEYDKSIKDYSHRLTDDGCVSETILFKVMCSHFIGEIMNTEVEILEDNTEEIEELDNWFVDERKECREFDIQAINLCFSKHRDKINELVKAVNKMKEGKE